MLMPRYYFAEDFRPFQDYFLSQPHTEKTFQTVSYTHLDVYKRQVWEPI